MLETGSVLRTWRLEAIPQRGVPVTAEPIGDHRLAYLDYEGPLSGGRGVVKQWDAGTFVIEESSPDRMTLNFSGVKLRGRGMVEGTGECWTFTYHGADTGKP